MKKTITKNPAQKANNIKKIFPFYLILSAIMLGSFLLMLRTTPYGAGVSPDSIGYIGAAKSLLAGEGYSIDGEPLVHHPPLFSVVLAVIGFFNKDFVSIARFFNIFLFSINSGLIMLIVYMMTGRRLLNSIFAGILFLSSAVFIEIHSWAWSEPLFITLLLLSMIFLLKYFEKPCLTFFILSALSTGLMLITRYAGIAFILVAVIALLIYGNNSQLKKRLGNALLWLVIACLPLGIFWIRNSLIAESSIGRGFSVHPLSAYDYIATTITETVNFVIPNSNMVLVAQKFWVLITILIVGLFILAKKYLKITDQNFKRMLVLCTLFSVSYVSFLYTAKSLFDASIPINFRLLSPLFVILIVGFSAILGIFQQSKNLRLLVCLFIIAGSVILFRISGVISLSSYIRENGLGYTSQEWQNSEDIAYAKALPKDVKIYTNGGDVLSFYSENNILSLPTKISPITLMENPSYNEDMKVICKDISEKGAILIYFPQIDWRWYLPSLDEIKESCN